MAISVGGSVRRFGSDRNITTNRRIALKFSTVHVPYRNTELLWLLCVAIIGFKAELNNIFIFKLGGMTLCNVKTVINRDEPTDNCYTTLQFP